ncbi:MAG TPA: hypothetical protein ENK18_10685 [Deltaproteobacteria bacterium]|nr:hypothetical protein [Deltaproteobacteria bacterium]
MSLLISTVAAAEPDPTLLAQARRQETTGVVELSTGATLIGGGLALMIVGRPGGQVSDEPPGLHELRTMGGIGLTLGGIVSMMAGGHALELASATREQAMLTVAPEAVSQGAGLRLYARF